MYKNLRSWLFAGLLLVAASCKDDEDILVSSPAVQADKSVDTLYIGDSTVLRPIVVAQSDVTFKWTVNGTVAGSDSSFKFKPTTGGDFQIGFEVSNAAGKSSLTYRVHVWGKYENGFFILSEGNFMAAAGDINFYDYGLDTVYKYAYSAENPGKQIGSSVTTLQFGTISNGKMYLVGKFDGPLVITDANTLKETGRIDSLPGHDGRAFLPIDDTKGLLSTAVGLYRVNLAPLSIGQKVALVEGEIRDMIQSGNYIFVLSATEGIIALNASDYSVAKKLGTAISGFAAGKDGSIWAASATQLKKINPGSLTVDSITTGFPVYTNPYTYTNSSIVASTAENAVYVISGTNLVYKYVVGNTASLGTPFITLAAGQYFYGKGIAYDKAKNTLVLNSNTNLYGSDVNNQLYLYNATTGALIHSTTYAGFFFPGMSVTR